jgi:formylglycine-generating enzyme required for sulfatase activity
VVDARKKSARLSRRTQGRCSVAIDEIVTCWEERMRAHVSVARASLGFVLGFALLGCENKSGGAEQKLAPPEQVPLGISVSGGTVNVGVFANEIRGTETVAAFRIAELPITVARHGACVNAGACSPAQGDGCYRVSAQPLGGSTLVPATADALASLDPELPATCVGVSQAAQYCAWVGGALPSLSEWLAAARGLDVAEFPWGAGAASCEQHPDGVVPTGEDPAGDKWQTLCSQQADQYRVAGHPAGAAASGMQDVLLASAELLRPGANSVFQACDASDRDACAVTGRSAGAIDTVVSVAAKGETPGAAPPPAVVRYAFRCVWEGP